MIVAVVLVILSALIAYILNYSMALQSIRVKQELIALLKANDSMDSSGWKVPSEYICMRFDDEGNITKQKNIDVLEGTNIQKTPLKDLFEKLRGRAMTGGGFISFKMVDPQTQQLRNYLFSSARHRNNTTCIGCAV